MKWKVARERLRDYLGRQKLMASDLTNLYLSDIIILTDCGPYALIAKGRVPFADNDWRMVDLM